MTTASFNIITDEIVKPLPDIGGSVLNSTQKSFEVLHSFMKTVNNLKKWSAKYLSNIPILS